VRLCLGLPDEPPCGRFVDVREGSRCPAHAAEFERRRDRARGSPEARGYDWDWRKLRLRVLDRDGWLCQVRLPVCTVDATTVDHVVPLARGGARLDPANCRAACGPCNSSRSAGARRRPDEE
jgi:5-methylcytosine-specific restriction protein A